MAPVVATPIPVTITTTTHIDIEGKLSDVLSNLQQLVTDLQAQGLPTAPLQNAGVRIMFDEPNTTGNDFTALQTAISNFRGQVVGTSITIDASFSQNI